MVLALLTKKIDFPAHRLQKSKTFWDSIAIGSMDTGPKNPTRQEGFCNRCCWSSVLGRKS